MKMVSKKFTGQLSGPVKKEAWFSSLKKELKLTLPEVGEKSTISLKPSKLDGAFLSCLDGSGALTVNGKDVSKMKVYSGLVSIPAIYSLKFTMARISEVAMKLSAEVIGK